MNISIVIPLLNEEESLPELAAWIDKVCTTHKFSYEIIFVDDGSTDTSWAIIQQLSAKNKNVKGIKFRRNYGKSAALNEGFTFTSGEVVITMDADLQDSPEEIPDLYKMIMIDGFDLVSGYKQKRYDPITKTIPTKFFNAATRAMSGIQLNDFNCGLKAYKAAVVKSIEVYGEMHRYIPVIAKRAGFPKIGEKIVQHQERKYGTTKFGLNRFINGFLDLLTITFITKFGRKPMHFFGAIGTICFLIGGIISVWLIIAKQIAIFQEQNNYREVVDQPLFYLALTSMIIGSQLFLAGFLGELIARINPERNKYQVEKRLGMEED